MAVQSFNNLNDAENIMLGFAKLLVRNRGITPLIVDRTYEGEFAERGDSFDIVKPNRPIAQTINPGLGNENTPTILKPEKIRLQITEWQETLIAISDLDRRKMARGMLPSQIMEDILPIPEAINKSIAQEMAQNAYTVVGTAGAIPSDIKRIREAGTKLSKLGVLKSNRSALIDPDPMGEFIDSDKIRDVSKSGNDGPLRESVIGPLHGFNMFESNEIYDHVNGDITDGGTNITISTEATVALGASSMTIDATSLNGNMTKGSYYTVAGDAQNYVITETTGDASGNALLIKFAPKLKIAISSPKLLTLVAGGRRNLLFHRWAYAFVSPQVLVEEPGGNRIGQVTDEFSGISMKLEWSRDNHGNRRSLSAQWGGVVVYPEAIVVLLDAAN